MKLFICWGFSGEPGANRRPCKATKTVFPCIIKDLSVSDECAKSAGRVEESEDKYLCIR